MFEEENRPSRPIPRVVEGILGRSGGHWWIVLDLGDVASCFLKTLLFTSLT